MCPLTCRLQFDPVDGLPQLIADYDRVLQSRRQVRLQEPIWLGNLRIYLIRG